MKYKLKMTEDVEEQIAEIFHTQITDKEKLSALKLAPNVWKVYTSPIEENVGPETQFTWHGFPIVIDESLKRGQIKFVAENGETSCIVDENV